MWHQVARLCLRRLVLFIVVSIASAIAIGAAPGDPLADLALSGQSTREGLDTLRAARGISDLPGVRVRTTLARLARLDLGDSSLHQQPVGAVLLPRLTQSLVVTAIALAIAWGLAALATAWRLARRGRGTGGGLTVIMAALQATPDIVVALAVLTALASAGVAWGAAGQVTPVGIIAASVVLATRHLPTAWQHLGITLESRLDAAWMQGLRARGIHRRRLVWRHAVRASAAPLLAVMAVGFGTLLSAGLVVETLFGIPGLGALMLDAMLARDIPLALGGVMTSAAVALAALTIADVVTLAVDPRTQIAGAEV